MMTADEAAPILGVPVIQLKRWAWERVGPRNVGTRWRPKYTEQDLQAWLAKNYQSIIRSMDEVRAAPNRS